MLHWTKVRSTHSTDKVGLIHAYSTHSYVQLCCCDTLVYITYSIQLHIHLQFHQSDLSPHNYEGVFRQLSNKRPLANLPISYHESLLASYALIVGFSWLLPQAATSLPIEGGICGILKRCICFLWSHTRDQLGVTYQFIQPSHPSHPHLSHRGHRAHHHKLQQKEIVNPLAALELNRTIWKILCPRHQLDSQFHFFDFRPDDDWSIQSKRQQVIFPSYSW